MIGSTLALPGPLARRVDEAARAFLSPDPAHAFDFATPLGEPALIAPDSVSWRIFKNPVTLYIGGATAVLLEFGEPKVRDGVWDHSTFRTDAVRRMQRTGLAAMVTVYGARSRAEAMIAGVVRAHERVRGVTSGGEAYEANDPVLLDWVQATAGYGFAQAYHAYARRLSDAELDRLFDEGQESARLYGAVGAPKSRAGMDALFERMRDRLEPSPIIAAFLDIMRSAPILPAPMRGLQVSLLKAAVELLPPWVRTRLELEDGWRLSSVEHAAVKAAARLSDRLFLPSSPAVQACRRLGLPDDYLYRSH